MDAARKYLMEMKSLEQTASSTVPIPPSDASPVMPFPPSILSIKFEYDLLRRHRNQGLQVLIPFVMTNSLKKLLNRVVK